MNGRYTTKEAAEWRRQDALELARERDGWQRVVKQLGPATAAKLIYTAGVCQRELAERRKRDRDIQELAAVARRLRGEL